MTKLRIPEQEEVEEFLDWMVGHGHPSLLSLQGEFEHLKKIESRDRIAALERQVAELASVVWEHVDGV